VAVTLNKDKRVRAYVVESENFESIHNHSAYAMIEHDKETAAVAPSLALGCARRRKNPPLGALQTPNHAAQKTPG